MRQSKHHPGLKVNDHGREPSTITKDWATFSVHYLHATQKENPEAPDWIAFTLVVFDDQRRVYPAEYFNLPAEQQPPGIDGYGATHLEAYADLKGKVESLEVGPQPEIVE